MAQSAELGPLESAFVRMFDSGPVGTLAAIGLVLACVGIGAAHALAPGHGKAIVSGYLVGQRGRPRDAVAFGVVVATMHTLSVLVIGVGLHLLGRAAARRGDVPPLVAVGPWLTVLAGLLVLGVGIFLLVRARHRRQAGSHEHHPLPAEVPPLSRRGLVLLGVSGGLLPSPSAFLVLTTGLFTGRTAFALLLIAAFSIGLATTLVAVGLAVLWGRERLLRAVADGPLEAIGRQIPLISSVIVLTAGAYLTVTGAVGVMG